MTGALQFTEHDWGRIARDWTAWWAHELERPLVMIENPVWSRSPDELSEDFLLEKPVDEVLDYYQSRLEIRQVFGDAWPRWFPFFGAGVVAGFLGVELVFSPGAETIWFEPDEQFLRDGSVIACDPENLLWQRVRTLTQSAVELWDRQVCVGFTDLGGNLDILASLQSAESLLLELVTNPGAVTEKTARVTRLWLQYYEELYAIIRKSALGCTPWAPIWAPGRCYMLQSDFSAMISPQMFETFVLPDLAACCDELDFTFYHLDGRGQINHLEHLLSLENLHGVQWIPGEGQPSPAAWLPLLQRIIEAGKLCQLYVSAQDAQTIVRELGGRGFAFYITENLNHDEAKQLVRVLTERSTKL